MKDFPRKVPHVLLPLVLMVTVWLPAPFPAYAKDYRPEPGLKIQPFTSLTELKFNRDGAIKADEVRIEEKRVNGSAVRPTVYRFFASGKLITELNRDGKYLFLGKIWTADLDRNGLNDFVIYAGQPNQKNSATSVIILFQVMNGVFKRLDYETYYFGPKNFTDLFHDGKCEVVLRSLHGHPTEDGLQQGFWVFTAYRIQDYSLRRMEFEEKGFPRFVRFARNRLSQETMKLSDRQKRGIYESRPNGIQSEYLTV